MDYTSLVKEKYSNLLIIQQVRDSSKIWLLQKIACAQLQLLCRFPIMIHKLVHPDKNKSPEETLNTSKISLQNNILAIFGPVYFKYMQGQLTVASVKMSGVSKLIARIIVSETYKWFPTLSFQLHLMIFINRWSFLSQKMTHLSVVQLWHQLKSKAI